MRSLRRSRSLLHRTFDESTGTDHDLRAAWHDNRSRRVNDALALLTSFAEDGSLAVPLDQAMWP
ncbi:hypothetical protein BH23ACT8_BH23ACT8_16910 [soil metagenome]